MTSTTKYYDYDFYKTNITDQHFRLLLADYKTPRQGRLYKCLWHEQTRTYSMSLYRGNNNIFYLKCHACTAHESFIDACLQLGANPNHYLAQPEQPIEHLDPATKKDYWTRRNISANTIETLMLDSQIEGHTDRAQIPLMNTDYQIVGYTSHNVTPGQHPKWLHDTGLNANEPYFLGDPEDPQIVVCEGASDGLAVYDAGYSACIILGATQKPDFTNLFKPTQQLLVCGDHDQAGKKFAKLTTQNLKEHGNDTKIFMPPTDLADLHEQNKLDITLTQQFTEFLGPKRIRTTTRTDPARWLIDDLIPYGGLTLVFGLPGTGKSWFGETLATAISTGKQWLDHTPATTGPTMIFDWENPIGDIVERQTFLGDSDDCYWYSCGPETNLLTPEGLAQIQKYITQIKPKFVFVDSLAQSALTANENDAADMSVLMTNLRGLAASNECGVMLLHHCNKISDTDQRGGKPNPLMLLRGSTAISAAPQACYYITDNHVGDKLVQCAKMRQAPKPANITYQLLDGTLKRGY